jgi:hypothetical protein
MSGHDHEHEHEHEGEKTGFALDALAGRGELCAMKLIRSTLLILPALLLSVSLLPAQEKTRVSPHETVNATVGDAKITIVYGRPYTKDPKSGEKRKIWGGLVPYGQVWRMGADEATLFTTDKEVSIGGTPVPAGSYSLFLLPEESGSAKLIVNRQTGQWGTKYDQSQDLGRIGLIQQKLDRPADQFMISVEKTAADGVLKLMWDDTQYSAAIAVKK